MKVKQIYIIVSFVVALCLFSYITFFMYDSSAPSKNKGNFETKHTNTGQGISFQGREYFFPGNYSNPITEGFAAKRRSRRSPPLSRNIRARNLNSGANAPTRSNSPVRGPVVRNSGKRR